MEKPTNIIPSSVKRNIFLVFSKVFFARFFNNSATRFTSFFAKDNELSLDELEEMKQIIEQQIADKKRLEK